MFDLVKNNIFLVDFDKFDKMYKWKVNRTYWSHELCCWKLIWEKFGSNRRYRISKLYILAI